MTIVAFQKWRLAHKVIGVVLRPWYFLPACLLAISILAASAAGNTTIQGLFVIVAILSFAYFCVQAPFWGCIVILFLALVLDDITWQFSTLTHDLGFFLYRSWWKFLSPENEATYNLLKFNTVEILIIATAIGVFLRLRKLECPIVLTPELLLVILFLLVLIATFLRGLNNGGTLSSAIWQIRPFFYLAAFCFLLTQTIQTERDLQLVGWTLITAVTLKAAQVVWIFLFVAEGRVGNWRQIVGHEDSVFFVAVLALNFSLWLYDSSALRRFLLSCLTIVVAAALILNLRRASYAAFALTMLLIPFVAHQRRKLALGVVAAVSIAAALYLAFFWNSDGMLGIPAQKVHSAIAAVSGTTDYNSNIYRASENINLWSTIIRNPLGTGFGKPFELDVPMENIEHIFPNWRYLPHNMVLGLWMSLGTLAFAVYLTVICGMLGAASFSAKQSDSKFVKAMSVFCFSAIGAMFFASAVDQIIWVQRGAIFLGIVMGIVSTISRMQGRVLVQTFLPTIRANSTGKRNHESAKFGPHDLTEK
jgi:O-antigen ligase